jgi:hypothetical protein
MVLKHAEKQVLHYPNLDTVLMVEKFIHEHSGEFKKKQIWQNLPRKTMYQTFCVVFDYLMESGKIIQDRRGTVGWIWNPELVRKYLKRKDLFWKP